MTILTSRPPKSSDHELMVNAAIRVLKVVCDLVVFTDDTPASIKDGHEIIEETLAAFQFLDVVIMDAPSYFFELTYDCAIRPTSESAYTSFKVSFKIRP
jgi:hypothetical protein